MQTKRSILSSNAIQELVQKDYALGPIKNCVLLKTIPNQICKIETDRGWFAFKIYNRANRGLDLEIEFLNFLAENGLHVSKPVESILGEYTTDLDLPEGNRKAVLMTFVDGSELEYDRPEHALLYGQFVAQLHLLSKEFVPTAEKNEMQIPALCDEAASKIQTFFIRNDRIEDWPRIQERLENVKEVLYELPLRGLAKTFIHGDAHGGNAHLINDQLAFFDFEYVGFGPIAYELAVFRWGAMVGKREWVWAHFLAGYRELISISDFDLDHVGPLIAVRDILVLSYHVQSAEILGVQYISMPYLNNRLRFLDACLLTNQ